MVKLDFTRPTDEQVRFIADNMCQADKDEVLAAGNESVLTALQLSVKQSKACVIASYQGIPLVIYGMSKPILGRIGVPWMLTTDQSKTFRREYMVYTRQVVEEMRKECDYLVNYVHAKNIRSIKWLKRLGFTIGEKVVYEKTNEAFYRFYMGAV